MDIWKCLTKSSMKNIHAVFLVWRECAHSICVYQVRCAVYLVIIFILTIMICMGPSAQAKGLRTRIKLPPQKREISVGQLHKTLNLTTYSGASFSMLGYFYWDRVLFNRRTLFQRFWSRNVVGLRRPYLGNSFRVIYHTMMFLKVQCTK